MSAISKPEAWPPDSTSKTFESTASERRLALSIAICSANGGVTTAPQSKSLCSYFKSRVVEENCFFSPAMLVFLTNCLSFFTYTDCDPGRIFALCVLDCGNGCLSVIVGVNSGEEGHNAGVLEMVCGRLQGIFQILDYARQNKITVSEAFDAVFKAVVSLDFAKIASQLGLSSACLQPPDGYPSATGGSSLNSTSKNCPPSILKHLKRLISDGASGLQGLHDSLVAILGPHETSTSAIIPLPKLTACLSAIHEFVTKKGNNYDSFFDSLPIRKSPDSTVIVKSVAQRLKYLSCYVSYPAALCNLAVGNMCCGDYPNGKAPPKDGKRSWTECIEVVAAPMTEKMYARAGCETPMTKSDFSFPFNCECESSSQAGKKVQSRKTAKPKKCRCQTVLDKANQAMGLKPDEKNPDILVSAKIHAECFVLLEIFRRVKYQNENKLYIASFKKPCTYCARLMAAFGCFYSQESHGKTYCGWRLASLEYMRVQFPPRLRHHLDGFFTDFHRSAADSCKLGGSAICSTTHSEELELKDGPFCKDAFNPTWCAKTGVMMTTGRSNPVLHGRGKLRKVS